MTSAAAQAARERHEANQLEAVIQRVIKQNEHGKMDMAQHVRADIQRLLDTVDKMTATHHQTLELWANEEVQRWKAAFYIAELEKFVSQKQRAEAVAAAQKAFDDVYSEDYWPSDNGMDKQCEQSSTRA